MSGQFPGKDFLAELLIELLVQRRVIITIQCKHDQSDPIAFFKTIPF